MTLSIEAAEEGGALELSPPLRGGADADSLPSARIAAFLDGAPSARSHVAPFAPGTLALFAGRRSLHRITRVARGRRASAVLCFADRPGVVNSPLVQRTYWGREASRAAWA